MKFINKIRAYRDLTKNDHNEHQSLKHKLFRLRVFWHIFITGQWELWETLTTEVDEGIAEAYSKREAIFLFEKVKKDNLIRVKHFVIFSKDPLFLERLFPRVMNQKALSFYREGFNKILFFLNNDKDSYRSYLENVLDVQNSEKYDTLYFTKHKVNYYILHFKLKITWLDE